MNMNEPTDFAILLKTELCELRNDVRSIEAYSRWNSQKLQTARRRAALLRELLSIYEGGSNDAAT
jgi:hypothetical protein